MANLKELRQRRAELGSEGRALLDKADKENRTLTAEEGKAYDEVHKNLEATEASIIRHEKQLEAERRMALSPDDDGQAVDGGNRFSALGEQLIAAMQAERDPRHVDQRLYAAPTGLGEQFPSEGGFLVQTDFAATLLTRTYDVGQILRRLTFDIPISGNANSTVFNAIDETSRADGSRWGGVQVFRAAEAATVTAKKPKFDRRRLELKKLMGLVYATEENLADSAQLEAIINRAFPEEMSFKIEDEVINGDGAAGMLGIINANNKSLVSVAKETGQLAKTLVYENLVNMWARMWAPSRQNAVWLINQDVEPQFFTMGITLGTSGTPVFLPPGGASGSPFSTFFGKPIIPVEYCPTLGTKGDVILADFSQYVTASKGGLKTAQSMHVRFLNDEMVFRFTLRNDGQPLWKTALTPFKGSNTLSPFIVLDTRS